MVCLNVCSKHSSDGGHGLFLQRNILLKNLDGARLLHKNVVEFVTDERKNPLKVQVPRKTGIDAKKSDKKIEIVVKMKKRKSG